jgi:hypothetical protein
MLGLGLFAKFLRTAKRLPRGFIDDLQNRLDQAIQWENDVN